MDHTIKEIDLTKLYNYLKKCPLSESVCIMEYFLLEDQPTHGKLYSMKDMYKFLKTFWSAGIF